MQLFAQVIADIEPVKLYDYDEGKTKNGHDSEKLCRLRDFSSQGCYQQERQERSETANA